LTAFPEEFAAHLEGHRCSRHRQLVMPKLVDIVDGLAVYDGRYAYKHPDWTYSEDLPPET